MVWRLTLLAIALSAMTLGATTMIDVSSAATVRLGSDDALSFRIPSWNYGLYAVHYGLPVFPTGVGFVLVSAAADSPAEFDASLQSADGSISETSGEPLMLSPGFISSANYSGEVSILQADFQLSAAISQQIFDGPGAFLMLRNRGPAMTLGLPPHTLQQDLFVSLSGGPLSVGALRGEVTLRESSPPAVPEPRSDVLMMCGGAFLCLLARLLRRFSQ